MTSPIQDRAEQASVRAILKLASELEVKRSVPFDEIASGEIKLMEIGLDPSNRASVTFFSGSRKLVVLDVGNAATWKDTVYCRVQDDPDREDIYVAVTSAHPILRQPSEAFRDSMLAGIQLKDVLSVGIRQGSRTDIELAREQPVEGTPWRLTRPARTLADSSLVESMLKRFLKARVQTESFVAESSGTAPAPSDEALVLTFQTRDNKQTRFTLEPPTESTSGSAQARSTERAGRFLVSNDLRDMFAVPDETTSLWHLLRSRRLGAGRLDKSKLSTVLYKRPGKKTIPLWLYGKWYLQRPGNVPELADTKKIAQLVEGLIEHEIVDFASDTGDELDRFGLVEPRATFEFGTGAHTGPDTYTAQQDPMVLHIGKGNDNKFYAKFENEPFVYQVDYTLLNLFPGNPVEWKNRDLLGFQQSSIQSITITRSTEPPVTFSYDGLTSEWTAERLGEPESLDGMFDPNRVEQLRQKLAVLSANEWVLYPKQALERLGNPTLQIQLSGRPYDSSKVVTRILRFAPTSDGKLNALYYGKLDGVPEPFNVRRETYDFLNQRLLTGENTPQSQPDSDTP